MAMIFISRVLLNRIFWIISGKEEITLSSEKIQINYTSKLISKIITINTSDIESIGLKREIHQTDLLIRRAYFQQGVFEFKLKNGKTIRFGQDRGRKDFDYYEPKIVNILDANKDVCS